MTTPTQTRIGSLIEACANTAIGFGISIALGAIIYPLFGHRFELVQLTGITAIFTAASIARGYIVRRWFNGRIHRAAQRAAAVIAPSTHPSA